MSPDPQNIARWAVAYHSNSHSPRARRWYRLTRVVFVDGRCFELHWHPDVNMRGNSLVSMRKTARLAGIEILPGIYRDKRGGLSNEMERNCEFDA